MKRRRSYQQKLIENYYQNREHIMLQSLGEVVSELYLASNDRRRAQLWKRAETALRNLAIDEEERTRIVRNHDLTALAKIVSRKF